MELSRPRSFLAEFCIPRSSFSCRGRPSARWRPGEGRGGTCPPALPSRSTWGLGSFALDFCRAPWGPSRGRWGWRWRPGWTLSLVLYEQRSWSPIWTNFSGSNSRCAGDGACWRRSPRGRRGSRLRLWLCWESNPRRLSSDHRGANAGRNRPVPFPLRSWPGWGEGYLDVGGEQGCLAHYFEAFEWVNILHWKLILYTAN